MTIPSELLEKYNMTSMEKYKEMFGDSVDTEVMVYKTFLIQTDHIPNKIIERLIEDLASATLLNFVEVFLKFIVSVRTEYKELLQYRKQAREEINRLTEETA
ncbi:MAG: hypothetical protein ACI4TD_11860 [Phocaeicola sp.]